ncbi:hypothetical protein HMPREF7215_2041 [Pyramidobacter piscolens W5455]|uniref:Uncharacterized protein n=1 Tax=Pyramidobacter piscolens W5455 TaxID=352165 RepID=A0ABM9ZXE5_9BACT|nr:hypothetical protein HMPREF7215_2041 [Pyramidobacter piscolens W5455]
MIASFSVISAASRRRISLYSPPKPGRAPQKRHKNERKETDQN